MIESLLDWIFDRAHPVGSYYWSSDSTNPSKLFGGTWEQVTDRFVLAAGSTYKVGATGGAATHTLTINEMPSHNHQIARSMNGAEGTDRYTPIAASGYKTTGTLSTGGGEAHNNMPPYEVAYCWKRIA